MQKNREDLHRYDDIIHLPRHVSNTHTPMAVSDRAAQFSPFAALTGHDEAIREAARLTDQRIELDENSKEMLNEKLRLLTERLKENPAVTVTYFVEDGKKAGGYYAVVNGCVKKVDDYAGILVLLDGTRIPLGDVVEIDGEGLCPDEY